MQFSCRFLLLCVTLTTFDQIAAEGYGNDSENEQQRKGQRSTLRNLEDFRAEIDDYVGKVMTAGRIPGFSLSVVNGDVDSLISGYGVTNIDRGDSVDVNSLFMIGSTTKAFTAALLLQLLRERNISLETPITELLPDFQLADFYRQQKATTRDILTHRMGIPDSVNNYVFGDVLSREELTRRSLYFKPLLPFRGTYYYSNINYNHAGKIIETLTGRTWEEVVRERLYVPLHMDNSTFYNQLTPEQQSRLVTPYEPYRNNGLVMREVPPDFHKHIHIGGPGCCVVSSAADLVHWLYTMTHGGLNEAGERVLDEQVVRDVMSPQSVRSKQPGFQPFTFVSDNYGFGWDTGFYQGYRMAIHDGYTYGFRSLASVYPELKLGIFTCINGKLGTSTAMIDVHLYIANLLVMGKEWTQERSSDVPLVENDHSAMQAIPGHVTYDSSYDRLERLLIDSRRRHLNSKKAQYPFLDEHVGVYGNFAFGNLTIQVDDTTGRLNAFYGDLLTLDLFQVDDTERFVSSPPEVAWFYPVFEVTFTRDASENTVISATVPTLFPDDPPVFIRGLRRDEAPLPPTCGPC